MPKIVNFGCCTTPGNGCVNVDGSVLVMLSHLPLPAALFGRRREFIEIIRKNGVKYATARRLRLPVASLDGFYASHVLEHLTRDDCSSLLTRVRGWLRPSGVLRVVLPDLRYFASLYLDRKVDADGFVAMTYLASDSRSWLRTLVSGSHHKWMYDADSFCALLRRLQYREVSVTDFATSQMPELAALDLPERREESFYVEARV